MNRELNYTWYAPTVISVTSSTQDLYKTSDRYKELLSISNYKGQHLQFVQKRWFPEVKTEDQLVYIDAKYEKRPDIISVDYYNTPLYAWAILTANGLRSVFQLEAGMYIKIPNIAEVAGGLK